MSENGETPRTERDRLVSLAKALVDNTSALLKSRRWRVGDRLGRYFAPGIKRRRYEKASDRLVQLTAQFNHLQAKLPIPSSPPPADARSTEWDPWVVPEQAQYAVIVLANVPWDFRNQRPQHIANEFARRGHRVFYVQIAGWELGTEKVVGDGVIQVEFNPSLPYDRYTGIPHQEIVAEWMTAIETLKWRYGIGEAMIHVHLQSWAPLAWALRDAHGWRVLYDCMDDWDGFPGMGRALIDIERELVDRSDLVVTTAETLRQKWAPDNPNTIVVRNGVDAEFFAQRCAPSNLLSAHRHPVIGFTGGLAPWIDFALIAAAARSRPDWTFVLVGDSHVPTSDLLGLDSMDNVRLLGLQPHDSMPAYLFAFDVAIIPFVVDRLTAAVDPVKFYEYAASGTPIVSTHLPEIAPYRHLFHECSGATSLAGAIEQALDEDPSLAAQRIELAQSNTWARRYAELDVATRALWPPLSIIVVTYGQLAFTRKCLESLIRNTSYPTLEIIVVDNGSTDGTPRYLRHLAANDPRITVVLNSDNRGFAAANNQGLSIASGEVLVLLNNDTELSPGWYVPLLQHVVDPDIGLVGPRSDHVGNSALIAVPEGYAGDLDGFARELRRKHDGERFDLQMLAMFCVAMRRDTFETVGPLDEGYGVGLFEDDDYAERIRHAGLRVVCARDAFVHHAGQATFKQLVEAGQYEELWERNLERFESRWGTWKGQHDRVEPVFGS